MKKIKQRLRNARAMISIQTHKRPRIFVIATMVFINIAVLLVAAFIAQLIAPQAFDSYFHALTSGSIVWLLTPNSILAIQGNPQLVVLATIVFIVGLVLFSGTIIALTTNAIKDYFQSRETGSGRIRLENHIVILNWNSKVPELVADLVHVKSKHVNLMILADIDKQQAQKLIRNAVKTVQSDKRSMKQFNVLIKQGDPLLQGDLYDISIDYAEAVLIMNRDVIVPSTEKLTECDLNVIKIVLGLGQLALPKKPTIVAEVKQIATKEKLLTMARVVKTLQGYSILPVCFDRRLGQIIAQTIIDKHIEDIYLSLFSFEGSEIYKVPNSDFETVLKSHDAAIPVNKEGPDCFVLSADDHTKMSKSSHACDPAKLIGLPLSEKSVQDVYIVGRNNKLSFILETFEKYERLHDSSFHAEWIEQDRVVQLVERLNKDDAPFTILLLSEEHAETSSLDANVIDTLIYLESTLNREDAHIIVELLDPQNDRLIKDFSIENTIISNKIVSLLLSKLALFPETAPFYEDLLTVEPSARGKDDYAIFVERAGKTYEGDFPKRFPTLKSLIQGSYEAHRNKLIMFAIIREEKLHVFEGNLHAEITFELREDDLCVFMKL
ncbi:MAG: DUF423 domain-containing protein [Acholeplasmatales bacterium]|nr:MAG: DUF423 domain-containing protein [Acholeplasmatales bacterium]